MLRLGEGLRSGGGFLPLSPYGESQTELSRQNDARWGRLFAQGVGGEQFWQRGGMINDLLFQLVLSEGFDGLRIGFDVVGVGIRADQCSLLLEKSSRPDEADLVP